MMYNLYTFSQAEITISILFDFWFDSITILLYIYFFENKQDN